MQGPGRKPYLDCRGLVGKDLGELWPSLVYMRYIAGEYQTTDRLEQEPEIVAPIQTYNKLTSVDRFFLRLMELSDRIGVYVRLPHSDDERLRNGWNPTTLVGKDLDIPLYMNPGDNTIRRVYSEIAPVYPTPEWMEEFGASPGDNIVISTQCLHYRDRDREDDADL